MTENVEGQAAPGTEQEPAAQVDVSGQEGEQLSQQGSISDGVSREEFGKVVDGLQSELRGLQGKQDKSAHEFNSRVEQIMDTLGVNLSPDQKQKLENIKLREEMAEIKASLGQGVPTPSEAGTEQVQSLDFLGAASEVFGDEFSKLSTEKQFELQDKFNAANEQTAGKNALFNEKRAMADAKYQPGAGGLVPPSSPSPPKSDENSIKDIEDSRELYALARKGMPRRKRGT